MTKSYGEEVDVKAPVVFAFRPTRFERIQADKLSVWEDHMRNNVGLDIPSEALKSMAEASSPSVCFCPDADDCDWV